MSLTHAEELKKRRNPFCEPPMAVIGSKPPEAILKSVILGGVYGQNYTLRMRGGELNACGKTHKTEESVL